MDAALGGGRGPGGLTPAEVEAKFRALERGAPGAAAADVEVDDELRALKRRVRVDG
ncbi:hypothetical protein D3C83_263510 [compost metagenome]